MKVHNKNHGLICIIAIFLWIGFVSAISFMEAWLKFKAPNVTVPIGLNIGSLVFSALNKVEWVFGGIVFFGSLGNKKHFPKSMILSIPLIILVVQTLFFLPTLYARASAIASGLSVSKSFVHFYYIFLEVVKVICLFVLGVLLLREKFNNSKVYQ